MQAEHAATTEFKGKLVAVGIGSPGRFRTHDIAGGKAGTIKPGTNENVGKTSDEFDNAALRDRYIKAISEYDTARAHKMSQSLMVANDGTLCLRVW